MMNPRTIYGYKELSDVPVRHRDIARYRAAGMSPQGICSTMGVDMRMVASVLADPVVSRHIEDLQARRAVGALHRVERIDEGLDLALDWGVAALQDPDVKDTVKMQLATFFADRHHSGRYAKQSNTRHEHVMDGLFDNSEIRKLKHAAAAQLADDGRVAEAQIVDASYEIVGEQETEEVE